MTAMQAEPGYTGGARLLVSARNLRAAYSGPSGDVVAVDGVSLDIGEGEVIGVAGESGCGKSTLGAILSLTARPPLRVLSGELDVEGEVQDLTRMDRLPRTWRGSVVSLLPQGALNSLSPTVRIRDLVVDVVRAHRRNTKRNDALDLARDRLTQLELPARVLDAYPHQLSGGMKQRVVTVISTLLNPKLLIADEPTSALDVSSQKNLIEMLQAMLEQRIMSGVIFITHDIPVLRTVSTRLAVMYAGRIVEINDTETLVSAPRHPYSAALMNSVLVPEPQLRHRRVQSIPGAPPNMLSLPSGCPFHPRCPYAMDECNEEYPPEVGSAGAHSACWWAAKHEGDSLEVAR